MLALRLLRFVNASLPATAVVLGEGCQLNLDAVDTVDAVNEEDEDEDKGDLMAH
jgi:hypothetical protein